MSESTVVPPFTTPAMAELFAPRSHVAHMLRVEAALARAQARAGVIPLHAADAIAAACRVELFDVPAIFDDGATAGTLVIPLVRALTAQVETHARGWVHWGATSQDVIDTALVLQMRAGIDLLLTDLRALCDDLAALADRHRHTVMAGRTLLQQALPITFGLKAARWLAMAARQTCALVAARDEALVVQLGGAAGTLASLGDRALDVAVAFAEELALPLPDLPWHAERDRVARVGAALGVTAGAMSKIALDLVLLAQTEVGEVAEGAAPGKGGSSALPQKRNPVDAMSALAAARLAIAHVPTLLAGMAQEHERAVGAWQAEWMALPALFGHTGASVAHVRCAVAGLEVDAARMRANLTLAGGALMAESLATALAPRVGRDEAQRLVRALAERAVRDGVSLHAAALADEAVMALLAPADVSDALDPARYLGSAEALVDRALAAYRRR